MKKLFLLFFTAATCTHTVFAQHTVNDQNILLQQEFKTATGNYRLQVKSNPDAARLHAPDGILAVPLLVLYQEVNGKWLPRHQHVLSAGLALNVGKDGQVEPNSIFIEDLNGDGVMEILGRTVWQSGSYPPFFVLASNSHYDTLVTVTAPVQMRYPVFYPAYQVISFSSGQIGENDTTEYFVFNKEKNTMEYATAFAQQQIIADKHLEQKVYSAKKD